MVLLILPVKAALALMSGIVSNPHVVNLMILLVKVADLIVNGIQQAKLAVLQLLRAVDAQVQINGTLFKNFAAPVLMHFAKHASVLTNGMLSRKYAVIVQI